MDDNPSSPGKESITACGGRLKDPSRYPSALYHGERVYFCSRACEYSRLPPTPLWLARLNTQGMTIDIRLRLHRAQWRYKRIEKHHPKIVPKIISRSAHRFCAIRRCFLVE